MYIKKVSYIFIKYEGEAYRLYPNGVWEQRAQDLLGWITLKDHESLEIETAYREELESIALEEADDTD